MSSDWLLPIMVERLYVGNLQSVGLGSTNIRDPGVDTRVGVSSLLCFVRSKQYFCLNFHKKFGLNSSLFGYPKTIFGSNHAQSSLKWMADQSGVTVPLLCNCLTWT